jgi:DNA-binding MarR family transcriptional regulator
LSSTREELIQRVFAMRPVLHRKLTEELNRELHDELQHVTINQLSVLQCLRDGDKSMRELARALSFSESSATAAADRLVRQGLVERLDDPSDRRVVLLALTAGGRELVDRVQEASSRKTSRMLHALSDRQLAEFVEICQTMLDAYEADEAHQALAGTKGASR